MTIEDVHLPDAALPAWQVYRRLLDTKAAHFEALAACEQAGGARLAAQAQLATLLAAHTAAVAAFKAALQALSRADPAARDALVAALTRLNADLVPGTRPETH